MSIFSKFWTGKSGLGALNCVQHGVLALVWLGWGVWQYRTRGAQAAQAARG